jgi:DNA-binding LacI/PurR family transcriptional regulator
MNYSILLINTEEQAANERDAIRLLLGRQVDGLVIARYAGTFYPARRRGRTNPCRRPPAAKRP